MLGKKDLHLHLADAFIQSGLQCIQVTHLLSVCVFPGNRTHNLCTANTMIYHWATGTKMTKNCEWFVYLTAVVVVTARTTPPFHKVIVLFSEGAMVVEICWSSTLEILKEIRIIGLLPAGAILGFFGGGTGGPRSSQGGRWEKLCALTQVGWQKKGTVQVPEQLISHFIIKNHWTDHTRSQLLSSSKQRVCVCVCV